MWFWVPRWKIDENSLLGAVFGQVGLSSQCHIQEFTNGDDQNLINR